MQIVARSRHLVSRLFATIGDASGAELGSGEGRGLKMLAELFQMCRLAMDLKQNSRTYCLYD